MIVEETLVSLGEQPVKKSPFSHVIVAMANSYFSQHGIERVTRETASNLVYERVWKLPKEERIELLNHTVGNVRDRNTYRATLLVVAVIAAVVIIPVMIIELVSSNNGGGGAGFKFLIEFFTLLLENFEMLTD